MSCKSLQFVKPEIRVLGIDDGKFKPYSKEQVLVAGVVFRGGYWLDGVMSTQIRVDAFDATAKISIMIKSSPHYKQLRVIMLNGITFAGFNIVDMKKLNEKTGLPVIAVVSKKPDLNRVHAALQNLALSEERWKAITNAGDIFPVITRVGKQPIYVEAVGISKELVIEILRLTSTRSKIPEPLRVAHMVASGISLYTT